MKIFNSPLLIIVFCILVFSSCKNKLNINAPYKEVPTIYAVLNPQETLQMIRVNKVFLGEGDANAMAQVSDSINYKAGDLLITLERFVNGAQADATPTGNKQIITFRDSVIQANPGAFNTTQRVYVTSDRLFVTGQYLLTVKNIKTSKVFTARANALDSVNHNVSDLISYAPFVKPYYPVDLSTNPNPLDPSIFPDYSSPNVTYSPKFFPNEAAIYTMTIRLHFFDSLNGDPNPNISKVFRHVDYNFSNKYMKDLRTFSNQKLFAFDFKGKEFMSSIAYSLSQMGLPNTIIGRKMYKMQAIAYSSSQEYVDFLQFSAPSLSIAQEKPIYSNFDNRDAMGIFTFRTRHSIYKEMASTFISSFGINSEMCHYHFFTADLSSPNWCF
jgi:hypothetical protein